MTTSSTRSFSEKFNTFAQTTGFLIASVWGIYTFGYKELWAPMHAPVNITMNLQLKKIGQPAPEARGKNSELIAVKMLVSATNPSTREAYLLPSVWMAYGYKVEALHDNPNFVKDVNDALKSGDLVFIEKHASRSPLSSVAVGRVFIDDSLKPNETVTHEIIFHVPPNQYDVIKVKASIPNTPQKSVTANWSYEDQKLALVPVMYFVNESGERKEMEKDKDGGYSYSSKEFDVHTAETSASLSLWQ